MFLSLCWIFSKFLILCSFDHEKGPERSDEGARLLNGTQEVKKTRKGLKHG